MIIFLNIILFIFAIYLQSIFLVRFDIFGLVPNIILILMVAFSLYRRTYEAYAFAFIAGLVLDSLSGGPFGLHTAVFMLIVFASSIVVDESKSNITNPLTLSIIGISSSVFYLTLWLTVSLQSKNFTFSGIVFTLGQIAITVVFFLIILPFLGKLFLWEDAVERSK